MRTTRPTVTVNPVTGCWRLPHTTDIRKARGQRPDCPLDPLCVNPLHPRRRASVGGGAA